MSGGGFGRHPWVTTTRVSGFAEWLREGRLCASKCSGCAAVRFPPVADCPSCLSDRFEWVELSGRGMLYSFTTIHSAPAGFEQWAPYVIGVVELEEGGRLMAPFHDQICEEQLEVGMRVQVAPVRYEPDGVGYELRIDLSR